MLTTMELFSMLQRIIDLIKGKVYRGMTWREFDRWADYIAIKRVKTKTFLGMTTYIRSNMIPEPTFEPEVDFAQELWTFLKKNYGWEENCPPDEFRKLVERWSGWE